MHLVINGKVLLIVLIGHIAPALKGSLSQVKSRREDEHLAQLDLIQLDLSENSFLLARDHEESLYNSSCPAIKGQEDILGHFFTSTFSISPYIDISSTQISC